MHMHFIEDEQGDVVDIVPYCSDYCHREGEGDDYQGWNGCREGADYDQACAYCGEKLEAV
jgi:hypothetical protein